MLKRYIIILIMSVLIVIFAVQNVGKVDIKLWFLDLNASLSLVIILTFAVGALTTLLLVFQQLLYRNRKISKLESELKKLKKESNSTFEAATGEFSSDAIK